MTCQISQLIFVLINSVIYCFVLYLVMHLSYMYSKYLAFEDIQLAGRSDRHAAELVEDTRISPQD